MTTTLQQLIARRDEARTELNRLCAEAAALYLPVAFRDGKYIGLSAGRECWLDREAA